jgi:hypothetical protein
MAAKRPRIEHTEDFQELLPLCWWPEQVEYERIRQPVLFGDPAADVGAVGRLRRVKGHTHFETSIVVRSLGCTDRPDQARRRGAP